MIKVLIVDDNIYIREALIGMLKGQDLINVIGECKDGIEVLPFLSKNLVDVIIMDVKMNYMDGLITTEFIKDEFPDIRIIGFSFNDDPYTKKKFLEKGADSFLSKCNTNAKILIDEIKK